MSPSVVELPAPAARRRLTGIVVALTVAKLLSSASGFITGPLLARALGATGRGDLAAMQVPFLLAPGVLALGIPAFAYRALPRGTKPADVFGSLGAPLLLLGVIAAACSVPVADAFAGSRETVRTYLIIGFLLTPLQLVGSLWLSALAALERWTAVLWTICLPFAPGLVGTVVLYAVGDLTLGWACALTVAGNVLVLVPAIPMLRAAGRPVFRRRLARDGIVFGAKSWAGGLAQLANLRLDQLLMITVVSPRVLGLYAVATTLAGVPTLAAAALAQPLMPRVAAGEVSLMARAVRLTIAVSIVINLAMLVVMPTLVPVLFGAGFDGAVPVARVLLIGCVPLCGAIVISGGLQADGAPMIPTVGELLALAVTVAGLLTLLRPLGGIGAAIVSVAAYSTSFAFQLTVASRRTATPVGEFLVPTRADLGWARALLAARLIAPAAVDGR